MITQSFDLNPILLAGLILARGRPEGGGGGGGGGGGRGTILVIASNYKVNQISN